MLPDRRAMLARCRSLALAAMLDAGGSPCWIAAAAPAAAAPAAKAAAGLAPAPAAKAAPATLTPEEESLLAGVKPAFLLSLRRVLGAIARGPVNQPEWLQVCAESARVPRVRVCPGVGAIAHDHRRSGGGRQAAPGTLAIASDGAGRFRQSAKRNRGE